MSIGFTMPAPDFNLSPITGWTREHWLSFADQQLLAVRPHFSPLKAAIRLGAARPLRSPSRYADPPLSCPGAGVTRTPSLPRPSTTAKPMASESEMTPRHRKIPDGPSTAPTCSAMKGNMTCTPNIADIAHPIPREGLREFAESDAPRLGVNIASPS